MTEPTAHDANLYAPPAASVVDIAAEEDTPQFYVVAPTKFLMLFFATFSAYSLYWFWRHWTLQKRRYTLDIWPIPRAIFQIFFAHSLNREIDFRLKRVDPRYRWSPGAHATVFVIFSIVGSVLDRLSANSIGSPYVDVLSILTLLPAAYAMLQAQKAANAACGDPKGATNARLTPANYVWLIIGLVLWAMIGLGLVAIAGDFE
jgi:hypothetical protein